MKPHPAADPALFAAWAEDAPDLLALSTPDGRLLWSNRCWRACFGDDVLPAGLPVAPALPGEGHVESNGRRYAWFVQTAEAAGVPALRWTLRDDTEAHRLRSDAVRLRELLEMAQEFGRLGVWERSIPDGSGRWDRHVFGFWGLDPSTGTPSYEQAIQRIHPQDRSALPYVESTRRAGRYAQRYRVIQPDGSLRWIHSQWEVKAAADGRPDRAIGIMVDDTEVWELARSLGDASAQLELSVDLAGLGIWRHDLHSNLVHYNDRAWRVLGLEPRPEPMTIDEVRDRIHPDDLPKVLDSARQVLAHGRPIDFEARYRHASGAWRHILTRRVLQRGADGQPIAFLGVALDVTDRVEREQLAVDLSARLQAATRAAGIGIWNTRIGDERAEWNDELYQLAGRDPALGAPTREEWHAQYVHPEDRAALRAASQPVWDGRAKRFDLEHRIVRGDGSVRWVAHRAGREQRDGRNVIIGVLLDVTERRVAEQALRGADERAALAARSAGIGTWELIFGERDDDTQIVWDAQMFRLRGREPRPTLPTREERLAILHPDDRAHNIDALMSRGRLPGPVDYEFRVLWPDGTQRWLASRSQPVFDDAGRVVRRIGVNFDITAAKEAQAAREQVAVAERSSRAKSQFLARMSHELRTPLNAVLGFTQLLQLESAGDAPRSAKLQHIRRAGEHLLRLIDDVLDLSSLEAGNLPLQLGAVPLAAVVDEALLLVGDLAARHEVRLTREALAPAVRGDRTRLLQVLVNLLSNGVKYNRPGGAVLIGARHEGETVALTVRDTGRGLDAHQLSHLFEPFNRLGRERDGIEGTGIGLTIVRALVVGMGGSLDVASEPGRGSCFTVRLPADTPLPAPADEPAPAQPPAEPAPLRRGRLLYVEDNPVNALLVAELARGIAGLELLQAADGRGGLETARRERPDLVLVDMQLPDFDGFELLRRLRAEPSTAQIPCIALSANAMPDDIRRALAAGFADYWTKPIDLRQFVHALEARFPATAA